MPTGQNRHEKFGAYECRAWCAVAPTMIGTCTHRARSSADIGFMRVIWLPQFIAPLGHDARVSPWRCRRSRTRKARTGFPRTCSDDHHVLRGSGMVWSEAGWWYTAKPRSRYGHCTTARSNRGPCRTPSDNARYAGKSVMMAFRSPPENLGTHHFLWITAPRGIGGARQYRAKLRRGGKLCRRQKKFIGP